MILFIGALVGPSIKATRIVAGEPVAVKCEIENIWLGQEGAPGAGPVRAQQVPRAAKVTMENELHGLHGCTVAWVRWRRRVLAGELGAAAKICIDGSRMESVTP